MLHVAHNMHTHLKGPDILAHSWVLTHPSISTSAVHSTVQSTVVLYLLHSKCSGLHDSLAYKQAFFPNLTCLNREPQIYPLCSERVEESYAYRGVQLAQASLPPSQ